MTTPQGKKQKPDYILLILNILIVVMLIGSVSLTISGQQDVMMAMAGPMGLVVILAGLRRGRRR